MVDRIVVKNDPVEIFLVALLLQILNLVAFYLRDISLIGGIVLGQALVATVGRQMLLFLAPHVEIDFVQRIAAGAISAFLGVGPRRKCDNGRRGKEESSGIPHRFHLVT